MHGGVVTHDVCVVVGVEGLDPEEVEQHRLGDVVLVLLGSLLPPPVRVLGHEVDNGRVEGRQVALWLAADDLVEAEPLLLALNHPLHRVRDPLTSPLQPQPRLQLCVGGGEG